ncbi:hypothetical protein PAL_GLEAN10003803 [Pteropus alecto]|uniref:Uncharacterized protein n=1 Tax=Pteropus alecto TaxID=9402 RepID=L5L5T8_PTEAL|nr:hypothetical protein PAL_GLEAN10003803 [Pteropus alecto]
MCGNPDVTNFRSNVPLTIPLYLAQQVLRCGTVGQKLSRERFVVFLGRFCQTEVFCTHVHERFSPPRRERPAGCAVASAVVLSRCRGMCR